MTSYHSVNDSHSRTLLRHWAGGQPSNGSCNLQSIFASGIGIQDIKLTVSIQLQSLASQALHKQDEDKTLTVRSFHSDSVDQLQLVIEAQTEAKVAQLLKVVLCPKKTCRHSHYILCCRSCCTGFSPITRPRRQECLPPSTHLAVKLQSLPSYHHGSVKNQHVRSWLSMPRAAFQKKRLVFSWTAIGSRCWWTVCLWYWNRHPSPLERNTCKLSKCLCLL